MPIWESLPYILFLQLQYQQNFTSSNFCTFFFFPRNFPGCSAVCKHFSAPCTIPPLPPPLKSNLCLLCPCKAKPSFWEAVHRCAASRLTLKRSQISKTLVFNEWEKWLRGLELMQECFIFVIGKEGLFQLKPGFLYLGLFYSLLSTKIVNIT